MKVHVNIYLVKDSYGNKSCATCEDSSDTIQICGMLNKDGKDLYFESDAYHLFSWCESNELSLKKIEDIHSFDTLWNQ